MPYSVRSIPEFHCWTRPTRLEIQNKYEYIRALIHVSLKLNEFLESVNNISWLLSFLSTDHEHIQYSIRGFYCNAALWNENTFVQWREREKNSWTSISFCRSHSQCFIRCWSLQFSYPTMLRLNDGQFYFFPFHFYTDLVDLVLLWHLVFSVNFITKVTIFLLLK